MAAKFRATEKLDMHLPRHSFVIFLPNLNFTFQNERGTVHSLGYMTICFCGEVIGVDKNA